MEKYNIVNGTAYDSRTPNGVIMVLEAARKHNTRIRIFYGDTETGRSWMDEWGMIGTVGRSTELYKIPLLILKSCSLGGDSILDHCIIRITEARGGDILYTHPNFHCPDLRVEPWGEKWGVFVEAQNGPHATFSTQKQAERWIDYVAGRRNNK